jgi:Zn-dependent peptidase ImmA (M78 family)
MTSSNQLLQLLRTRRMSPSDLGRLAEIAEPRIEEIVAGADASLGELRRISQVLKLSIADLVPSNPTGKSRQLLFRSAALQHQRPDPVVLDSISRKMDYSLSLVNGGGGRWTWWLTKFERNGGSYAEAERNAAVFRELFFENDQVSPVFSLPHVAAHRMNVILFTIRASGFDGASAFLGGVPFVFISERFPPRMLFTLAHELGHLLSHHDLSEDFAFLDKASPAESEFRSGRKVEEQYAHAFASCLLMPAAGVGIALKKIRELHHIKGGTLGDVEVLFLSRIYGVSFAAAAKRCEDLRLLPRGGAQSLDESLRKKYGSAEKRAESLSLPERHSVDFPPIPEQLLAAAIEKIRSGEISVGKAASVLGLSIADLFAANAPASN